MLRLYLDARHVPMVAHAELAEAQSPQEIFGGLLCWLLKPSVEKLVEKR
jgi:hypothetical protein